MLESYKPPLLMLISAPDSQPQNWLSQFEGLFITYLDKKYAKKKYTEPVKMNTNFFKPTLI